MLVKDLCYVLKSHNVKDDGGLYLIQKLLEVFSVLGFVPFLLDALLELELNLLLNLEERV